MSPHPHPSRHPHSQLVLLALKKGDFVKKGGLMSVRVVSETHCEQSCGTLSELVRAHTVHTCLFLFSRSVMSESLRPHGLQHARPPCPSPAPELSQTQVHQVGDAPQPSRPLSSRLLLPSIFLSIRVFSNGKVSMRVFSRVLTGSQISPMTITVSDRGR